MALIRGILRYDDGTPNIGALVVLKEKTGLYDPQKMVTDDTGEWRFDAQPGVYSVEFYGSETSKDDWIEEIIVSGDTVPAVVNSGTVATITAIESTTAKKGNSLSQALVDITNVEVIEGTIASLIIEASDDNGTTWSIVSSIFGLGWSATNTYSINDISVPAIAADQLANNGAGKIWKFRVRFFNDAGQPATYDTSGGTVVELETGDVYFNGVNDAAEIFACLDVRVNGSTGSVSLPSDRTAVISWKDLQDANASDYSVGGPYYYADGTQIVPNTNLTTDQIQQVTGYEIFMYIQDTAAPPHPYPETGITEGKWQFVASVPLGPMGQRASYSMTVPPHATVYFWVGARTKNTITHLNYDDYEFTE